MTAGTVFSDGFPGRVAQEVQPNPKCRGCLHYVDSAGRTGACSIGLRPWLCGDGDAQDIGYAPITAGAGAYLPDMVAHVARARETEPQDTAALYGAGSTRPVQVHQVSLGEEHVHLIKSLVERHVEMEQTMCRLCKSRGAIGRGPMNNEPQSCSCKPIEARTVAKSLMAQLSNRERSRVTFDDAVAFVYDVADAGFAMPIVKAGKTAAEQVGRPLPTGQQSAGLSWKPKAGRGSVAERHLGSYHVGPAGSHADGFSAHYMPKNGDAQHLGEHSSEAKAKAAAQKHFMSKSNVEKGPALDAHISDQKTVQHFKSPHGSYKIEHHPDHSIVHYKPKEGSPAPAQSAVMKHGEQAEKVAKVHAFVNNHSFGEGAGGHATLHEDHVKVHEGDGEKPRRMSSMKQARDHLGY